jgi:hypothetical protein
MKIQFTCLLCCLTTVVFAQSKGVVTEVKDPLIDSLIAKRLELNKRTADITIIKTGPIVTQMGYRVQIFYGSNRKETFGEQSRFKAEYPRLNTYITYKEPNYYLRVGDFRTRMEAQSLMNELRSSFPTLFIFREKINAPDLD